MAPSVTRSLSTPDMRAPHRVKQYQTDKRRNKLGYHRTSVACGHCRRRKIRCLMAKDDPAGRCSNCIRLKKDCNFYPVETTDRRPSSSSKPDILNNDGCSAASSPSPGLGQGQTLEYSNGHPASVPVTPISERPNFEDGYLPNRAPGPSSRISQSVSGSRRPSIVCLDSGSLEIKPQEAYISQRESVPRAQWEVSSQQEMSGLFGQYGGFEDPSTTYWRLNSPSIRGGHYPQHALHTVKSMASLTAPESLDSCDDGMYSEGTSRVGSIDQGIGGVFGYPTTHSPEEVDFGVVPDLRSASASTASLTASVSEASQYGAPAEPGYGPPCSMTQWYQTSNGVHFDPESMVKEEDVAVDAQYLFAGEDGYWMNGDFHQFVYPGQHVGPIVKPDQE